MSHTLTMRKETKHSYKNKFHLIISNITWKTWIFNRVEYINKIRKICLIILNKSLYALYLSFKSRFILQVLFHLALAPFFNILIK